MEGLSQKINFTSGDGQMIELIIQFGKGYHKPVHTMYFDDYDLMKEFLKKLDGISNQHFAYEWNEVESGVRE